MTDLKTTAENEYGRYSVPDGVDSRPAVRLIKEGRVYEPATIAFLRDHAGTGDIIHAGTFFGDFLPGVRGGMAPDAILWAFEANPDSFDHAVETARMNGLEGVELANNALSDRTGEDLLFRTHKPNGTPLGGHARVVDEDGPGVVHVPATMLDFAVPLARPVSIVQLDIEGHEPQALLGAYHLLHRWRPILVLEEFDDPAWLATHFPRIGYRQDRRLHGNLVYLPDGMAL